MAVAAWRGRDGGNQDEEDRRPRGRDHRDPGLLHRDDELDEDGADDAGEDVEPGDVTMSAGMTLTSQVPSSPTNSSMGEDVHHRGAADRHEGRELAPFGAGLGADGRLGHQGGREQLVGDVADHEGLVHRGRAEDGVVGDGVRQTRDEERGGDGEEGRPDLAGGDAQVPEEHQVERATEREEQAETMVIRPQREVVRSNSASGRGAGGERYGSEAVMK